MIVRRVPIDFAAVSKDTGIVNGTIGHGALGWVVRDNDCKSHYSVSLIDPPASGDDGGSRQPSAAGSSQGGKPNFQPLWKILMKG